LYLSKGCNSSDGQPCGLNCQLVSSPLLSRTATRCCCYVLSILRKFCQRPANTASFRHWWQESRAKLRHAAAAVFSLKFANDIRYKFSSQASEARFRPSNIGALGTSSMRCLVHPRWSYDDEVTVQNQTLRSVLSNLCKQNK